MSKQHTRRPATVALAIEVMQAMQNPIIADFFQRLSDFSGVMTIETGLLAVFTSWDQYEDVDKKEFLTRGVLTPDWKSNDFFTKHDYFPPDESSTP